MLEDLREIREKLNQARKLEDEVLLGFAINKLDTFMSKNREALRIGSVSNNEVAVCNLNPDFRKYLIAQGETHCKQCGKPLQTDC